VREVRRHARRLYSAREVAQALDRMAAELTPRLRSANPVVLELCKRFRFAHELDYVHLTRYRGETRGGALTWRVRPRRALAGRTVLVVDDILDRGKTLRALATELRRIGVAEHFGAVLVVKQLPGARRPSVTAAGLAVEDVYVFGSGMDYRGYWRALPGIYAVAAERT
jgi:hypoxanthine phosphoribosyltransferase